MVESIRKSDREQEMLALCDGLLSPLGFRPVDLDYRASHRSLLRLYIERLDGGDGEGGAGTVSLEDCALVSRTLGPVLDETIEGSYDLEVSSPGLDRRLRVAADFQRVLGADVKLKLAEKLPGRGANVVGKLLGVESGALTVDVDGTSVPVPLEVILQAVRVWRAPEGRP